MSESVIIEYADGSDMMVILVVTGILIWILRGPVMFILSPFFWLFRWAASDNETAPENENKELNFQPIWDYEESEMQLETSKGAVHIKNVFRGVLIVGGPGSGKSASIVNPIISQAMKKRFGGIIYDWKYPELSNIAYNSMPENSKVTFFHIALHQPKVSARINPLQKISSPAIATEFATTIFFNLDPEAAKKKDFFVQSAISILAATIYFFYDEQKKMSTIPHVVAFILMHSVSEIINIISQNSEVEDMVASIKSGLASDNQSAGVIASLQNNLAKLADKNLYWVLSGDDVGSLDLNNPENKKMLCVANDSQLSQILSPLVSLIINSSIRLMNVPGKEKSIILLDEAPTLYLPKFENLPATSRSNKISVVFACQDISQSEEMYGDTKTESIISNLSNHFYGRTTNPKTVKRIVDLFGKYDKQMESTTHNTSRGSSQQGGKLGSSSNKGTSEGRSISYQERNRIQSQEIIGLESGEFCIMTVGAKVNEHLPACLVLPEKSTNEHKALPLPSEVPTDEDIKANYAQIKRDVKIMGKVYLKNHAEMSEAE